MKESFEQQPELDMTAKMQLQAQLLEKNHPSWTEDTGKTLAKHEEEMLNFGKEFRDFIDAHPDIVEQYKDNPEETVEKLENKFYH
jgi:GrpB-like predicted nucleotidyltransferase (UPF0157 family)